MLLYKKKGKKLWNVGKKEEKQRVNVARADEAPLIRSVIYL